MPDAMTQITPGAIGIWVLVFGLFGAMVKVWPALKKLANERESGALAARAEDMDDMRKRITDLEAKVDEASHAAHAAEMKLVYAVSAVQLLAAKIRHDAPNDPALLQAMELLKAATSGELPSWGAKLATALNQVRGTGE